MKHLLRIEHGETALVARWACSCGWRGIWYIGRQSLERSARRHETDAKAKGEEIGREEVRG